MLKVLINAYACCPGMGSEQGMSWNFISNIAKYCECFVITESEYKEQNEVFLKDSHRGTSKLAEEIAERIHFYFVPVGSDETESAKIRKMCWNQGTWSFYKYYADWQEKILPVAEQIIEGLEKKGEKIDIMHQLNMVGFREPGMLYKINERRELSGKACIPLIWGPSAGFGSIPFSFMIGGGVKFTAFYLLKNFLNKLQLKWHPRVRKMVDISDALIAATPEMQAGFKKYYGKDVELINETGTYIDSCKSKISETTGNVDDVSNKTFKLLWVGRFMYTKQLTLALSTMTKLFRIPNIELHIVGKAFDRETEELMHYRGEESGCSERIKWHGQIPNAEVQKLMRECDVFFFTSIFEATSTVILEAISNNLPIVCFDRCGFGPIVDEKIGRKIPCKNPKQAVDDFAKEITYLYNHPEELKQMSRNCDEKKYELSWDRKIEKLMGIYNSVLHADKA